MVPIISDIVPTRFGVEFSLEVNTTHLFRHLGFTVELGTPELLEEIICEFDITTFLRLSCTSKFLTSDSKTTLPTRDLRGPVLLLLVAVAAISTAGSPALLISRTPYSTVAVALDPTTGSAQTPSVSPSPTGHAHFVACATSPALTARRPFGAPFASVYLRRACSARRP